MGFSYGFSYGFSHQRKGFTMIHRLTINNRLRSDPMAISSHLGDGIGFFASGFYIQKTMEQTQVLKGQPSINGS